MTTREDYEKAKSIVKEYEEDITAKKAVALHISNLSLSRGKDGHWLYFKTTTGLHAAINIEREFPLKGIVGKAIRQWAQEQEA